ncbi:hypothetical protein [Prosthecobacter sp.]|uniref:hypothetical protein n=1 Tax=Prosthecobacter sp. TaxID=1965333 RepID=UPI0037833D0B
MNDVTATPPRRGRFHYTRFIVCAARDRLQETSGVITELRLLKEAGNLTRDEYQRTEALFEWFNEHLPCPPFSSSNWPRDAISWFKPAAQEHVEKMEEIIAILAAYDLSCRTLHTQDPGFIHYEDDFQVVASSPHF